MLVFWTLPGYRNFRSDSPGGIRKHGVCTYTVNSVRIGTVVKGSQNILGAISVLE